MYTLLLFCIIANTSVRKYFALDGSDLHFVAITETITQRHNCVSQKSLNIDRGGQVVATLPHVATEAKYL